MDEAKRLVFEGEVDFYGVGAWHMGAAVHIGGRNIFAEIKEAFGPIRPWRGESVDVRVVLGVESLEGELHAAEGFTGTDVTPYEPPEFNVGGIDLIGRLCELDGKTVALTVEAAGSEGEK